MAILALLLVMGGDNQPDTLSKKMLPIYLKEVEEYSLAVESAPKKPLDLKKETIFEWSNPVRSGGQFGAIYLWLRNGRPAALGCVASQPEFKPAGRRIVHELHALDSEKLLVSREGMNQWKPQAGLERAELPGAPAPAATAAARLIQLRQLAKEFDGHSIDGEGKRWDLRLLPAPLYRYPAADTEVVDGALFAFVSNAGTDPEVLLLIEARVNAGKGRWEYACGRFSDWELRIRRKEKEVWSSVPSETNPVSHNPLHTYRVYPDKVMTTDGKLLARIRQTEQNVYGEVIPVKEK